MKKLSIITVCYNDPNLEDTCKSIVNQTSQDFEWIVIDGGSNEKTLNIFAKYKSRIDVFVSEKDNGIYNAMNKGINLSTGKYLLFMNAGDIFYENDVLEKANVENFEEDIIYCNAIMGTDEHTRFKIDYSKAKLDVDFFINNYLHHQSTFIKKELFEKYGLYNENNRIVSDWEKWIEFIIVNKCSHEHLNIICGCNNTDGISRKPEYMNLLAQERSSVIQKYFTPDEINKIKENQKTKYSFLEQIFSIKNNKENTHKIITILGIHMKASKTMGIDMQKIPSRLAICTQNLKKNIQEILSEINSSEITVFFDHCWGGGTEFYFYNYLKKHRSDKTILRIQYIKKRRLYKLTFDAKDCTKLLFVLNQGTLVKTLKHFKVNEIFINHLAQYKKSILNTIKTIKNNSPASRVIFCTHDYYSICPTTNLMNKNFEYCTCPEDKICKKCYKDLEIKNSFRTKNIKQWRKIWKQFFNNTADEILVFSESSKEILAKIYPETKGKIKVIPHEVNYMRKVVIPKHKNINIACIGNITEHKGKQIVEGIESLIQQNEEVSLYVIGSYEKTSEKTTVTGVYKINELPDLVEKYQIDIIFIPSVWPETFSYTTEEGIKMEIPIACFNLGAPSERVSKYKKGLIISQINSTAALTEIVNFVKKSDF